MKQVVFPLLLIWIVNSPVCAQFSKERFLSTGLVLVDISTVKGVEPTCEFVQHPDGSMGVSTTNVVKAAGRMLLLKENSTGIDTLYDSGNYVSDESGMTIKIRGNTSAYSYREIKKFPFKIDLQKKADLLLRGNSKYKDKNWVLINTANKFGNDVGRKLSEFMGMPYTPAYEYVNVFINDNYRGTYLLSEDVRRNADCRINVDKECGYIVEHDPYWWNEDIRFGEMSSLKYKYTFKYPNADDVLADQVAYISAVIADMENRANDGTYSEAIDVESFARWLLAEDILGSWDGGGVNVFIAKADSTADTKFTMPCLWDYDSSFECGAKKWSNLRSRFIFPTLMDSENREFAEAYKNIWQEHGKEYCQKCLDYINEFCQSDILASVSSSFGMEEAWYATKDISYLAGTFSNWLTTAKQWFTNRPIWMDEQIANIPTGIRDVMISREKSTDDSWYDIQGRRIPEASARHGIFIHKGKKIVR